jgi:hypothetical protein
LCKKASGGWSGVGGWAAVAAEVGIAVTAGGAVAVTDAAGGVGAWIPIAGTVCWSDGEGRGTLGVEVERLGVGAVDVGAAPDPASTATLGSTLVAGGGTAALTTGAALTAMVALGGAGTLALVGADGVPC